MKLFICLSLIILVFGCERQGASQEQPLLEKHYSQNEINDLLIRSIDDSNVRGFFEAANTIKRQRADERFGALFENFWVGDCGDCIERKPKFLEQPEVRIVIADLLTQMSENGLISGGPFQFVDYAKSLLQSGSDSLTLGMAIRIIGVSEDKSDVDLLLGEARKEDARTFYAAIGSLSHNCVIDWQQYDSFVGRLKSNELSSFARDTWRDSQAYREIWCTRANR